MSARGCAWGGNKLLRRAARHVASIGSLGLVVCFAVGCGSSNGASSRAETVHGTVDVLYAGSLVRLMEHEIGPSFSRATGISFSGFGAGSSQLGNEIKGSLRTGDVFISASPQVDAALEGSSNGNWVSWVAAFASAPVVLGFEPHSRFAAALHRDPWERVLVRSDFLVGRTDPVLDPKGKLTVEALQQAARDDHDPSLLVLLRSTANVFPEESLLGRLQAGQLDAGFFYANEAKEAGLATTPLTPVSRSASYTVTVLERAPHRSAADAFVSYLLGPPGRRFMAGDGLHVRARPRVSGTGVPRALVTVLRP